MKIDRWATIHAYQRLVKAGDLPALTSPAGWPYIVRIGPEMEPQLWDSVEDTYLQPSVWWWEKRRDDVDRAELDALDRVKV